MKRVLLWSGVVVLVALGVVMLLAAVDVHDSYPPVEEPIVREHDPKVRQMLEEEQRRQQREEYKTEFEYLTLAALEFTIAAFLAGRARRIGR
jgi:hypothetical protein